jgi:photosystem II stability/assembly factor-like uncharacterized protein
MPLLRVSASDVTATVKASAQVNGPIGGSSSRSGNSAPPPAGGASAGRAIVTQSAVAKSGSGTFSLLRSIVTGPIGRRITWSTAGASVGGILSLASSTNGMIAYYTAPPAQVFKTTNGGVTWTQVFSGSQGAEAMPTGISCSDDGSKLIFATVTSLTPRIYTSTDGGATFTTLSVPAPSSGIGIDAFQGSYVSGDGSFFMLCEVRKFHTSTDGITWTVRNSTRYPAGGFRQFLASTDTGSVIYSGSYSGVSKSIDQGVNWTELPLPSSSVKSVHSSSDGRTIVTGSANSDTRLFISRDSGVTFTTTSLVSNQSGTDSVSCSNSGDVIVGTTATGLVYAVLDGGPVTLQTIPGSPSVGATSGIISAATVSGNGSRIIVSINNRIYIGTIA